MSDRSWSILDPDPVEWRLPEDLRARDPFDGRDCGWVSQMRPFVRRFSRPGDTVFDPFCGFGTTLLASALEGRRGCGVEIDPDRIALARERLRRHGIDARIERGTLPQTRPSGPIHLCLTSVPYFGCAWTQEGQEGQLYDSPSFDRYLTALREVFHAVHALLPEDGFCIAMVENASIDDAVTDGTVANARMVPQAWELARILGSLFEACEERILLYPPRAASSRDSADPARTDRSHEYALVFRKRRPRVDVDEAQTLLASLRESGFAFTVVGSFRDWLERTPASAVRPPSDLDLCLADDPERLRALLRQLESLGFRLSLWGDPVNADVRPETIREHHYLRAERLQADGRLLRIDLAIEGD